MVRTEDTYLRLLRRAVWGEQGSEPGSPTEMAISRSMLQEIMLLCRIQGTGPLIYNELLKKSIHNSSTVNIEEADGLPTTIAIQMKQQCLQNMMLQGQWEQLIAKCFTTLADSGIHAVMMKGFAYARLYPLLYLRAWGDLDVWVGPDQYHQACGVLRQAFPDAKHHDEEWDELKHYCFVFENGMAIELHRVSMDFLNPNDQAYWCRLEAEASQLTYAASQLTNEQLTCSADNKKQNATSENLVINGVEIPLFDPKFDLLFCFMHSWEHFTGTGIPLKQVCDMALLVRNARHAVRDTKTIEQYLLRHLRALKMLEVWRYYGYMACKVMAIPMAEWPLLGKSEEGRVKSDVVKYGERLYSRVMSEGQCRKHDYGEAADKYEAREQAKKMNVFARKAKTLNGRIKKAMFLHHFAPRYARYMLWQEIKKGIRRTIQRKGMIDY